MSVLLRALLVVIVATATAGTAAAQTSKRTPVLGVIGTTPPTTPQGARIWDAFALGLREGGWIEGKTLRIEWRWGDGRPERFAELAAELARLEVDVIVAGGTQATKAAKEATGTTPIVFVAAADPVGAGLVASLAKPGGNVTGVTNQLGDLGGKWLQLAKDMVPGLSRLAIIWNPSDQGSTLSFKDAKETYARLGVNVISIPVASAADLDTGFEVLTRERPDFLLVHPSPLMFRHRQRIAEFALRHRLPTSSGSRAMTEDGSIVMSYGPDVADLLRRAAGYVDKVLKGARPASLPVEQPTRFEVVVNLRAARAIGLELKPAFLTRADHVIE